MKVVVWWIGVHDWLREVVIMFRWVWYCVGVVNLFGCEIEL